MCPHCIALAVGAVAASLPLIPVVKETVKEKLAKRRNKGIAYAQKENSGD